MTSSSRPLLELAVRKAAEDRAAALNRLAGANIEAERLRVAFGDADVALDAARAALLADVEAQ